MLAMNNSGWSNDSVDRNGLKSKSGEMTRHFFYECIA